MSSQTDLSVSSLFNFKNHVVLVTGGSTGLGEMAAQGFVQNGARVIIASRKESALKKTTDRLNSLGPGVCEYVVADLKDKAGCDHLVNEVKKRTDRLTVLVNNTGATWGAPYDDFPESGWDKIMALNVKAIFYMTVGLQPLLQKGTNAEMPSRVINIASTAGVATGDVTSGEDGGLSPPGHGPFSYGPSKAACIHLSKTLASKLAPLNIMVNCICPGLFPSRMSNFGIEKFGDALLQRQPTGRIGRPSDFAGLVLFLSSLGSAHMTGNVLVIDGGSTVSGWRGRANKPKI
ncbi:short chain dehydrogenase/reductase family [Aspergillus ambiguus]|uniref:short chain dehydrogenase/reductase family n=1 Tax=Aspergillus ambiguus TaxID=176160 RepID=UPI003CCCBEF0